MKIVSQVRCVLERVTIAICLMCCSSAALADNSSWWKTRDQRGVELLQSGDPAAASEVFTDSEWRGISHYRNGNFAEAQKEFAASADPNSLYNEGTAAARAGDYQTAVEKFEQVAEADPTHADANHNLGIARQLLEQQQQSSDDSSQGDEQDEQGDSEKDQSQSAEQNGDQRSGDQQQSDQGGQQEGDSQSNNSKQKNADSGGELSTSTEDAQAKAEDAEQSQDEQTASDPEQSEQEQAEHEQAEQEQSKQARNGSAEPSDSANVADLEQTEPISETEQATEQWMRRIPDDPSQLLRNKIKLNHMIQHENVRDMVEPW